MFNQGFGNDAIAIPFDVNGRVAFAPVYIYTIRPESWERVRLAALFHGLTAQPDVLALFGRPAIRTRLRGYEVWYYEIRVHNPFEEYPDVRGSADPTRTRIRDTNGVFSSYLSARVFSRIFAARQLTAVS